MKIDFEKDINVIQDAYIGYQSWSNEPNNWVVVDGTFKINNKTCKLLYQWDGESELDTIDYNNPYDIIVYQII